MAINNNNFNSINGKLRIASDSFCICINLSGIDSALFVVYFYFPYYNLTTALI